MADQRCVCIDCVFSNGVREMVGFLVRAHVRVDWLMTRGGGGHADNDDDDARQLRAQCVINHTQAGAGMVWGM